MSYPGYSQVISKKRKEEKNIPFPSNIVTHLCDVAPGVAELTNLMSLGEQRIVFSSSQPIAQET